MVRECLLAKVIKIHVIILVLVALQREAHQITARGTENR